MDEAARGIESFVDDLSRWYIRRSRRRFQQPQSREDLENASATLREVLLTLSKIIAPFVPFFAESLYKSLEHKNIKTLEQESVHLCDWPEFDKSIEDEDLLASMEEVRRLATIGLAARAESKIKVRQPLKKLKVKSEKRKIAGDLLDILKDEVNVKEIVWDSKLEKEVELDVVLTKELREEGVVREFVRMVQDLRQSANYKPQDIVILSVELPDMFRVVLENNILSLKKDAKLSVVEFKKSDKNDAQVDTEMEGNKIWLGVRR